MDTLCINTAHIICNSCKAELQHAKHDFEPSLCVYWIDFFWGGGFAQSATLFISLLGRLHLGGQPITEMVKEVKDMSG